MTATERARRSDALHYGDVKRRELCDIIALREDEIEHLRAEVASLRRQLEEEVTARARH